LKYKNIKYDIIGISVDNEIDDAVKNKKQNKKTKKN
jgi:hypothetical protein